MRDGENQRNNAKEEGAMIKEREKNGQMLRIGFGKKCERERAMWGWLMILQVPRIVYRLASIVLMLCFSSPLSLSPPQMNVLCCL